MANSKQATKRARQAKTRRSRNMGQNSEMRTALKATLVAIKEGKDAAQSAFAKCVSLIDKLARKNVIHPNRAARMKSRLHKKVKTAA